MYIVHVSSELAPVAKVGGLADVVFGLSRELEIRGNDVEIILPKYDCMRYDHIYGLNQCFDDLWVPWNGGSVHCSVFFGYVHGRKVFFIDPHSGDNFFNRGVFYGHNDDAARFAFFSRAAMEFMLKSGKRPDVIHCHDWQTGLVPVFLYEIYAGLGMHEQRVCYTVHNFKHQGLTSPELLWATGLGRPEYYMTHERMRDNAHHTALNLMKGGIVYSNFVTTVSPHHAWEARFTECGFGLQDTLNAHQGKYGGVLNGCDYDVWNPEIDPQIAFNYSTEDLEGKFKNKQTLRERLMMRDDYSPVVAYIGRLDHQKGVHLIRHAMFHALENGAQFVLLGSSPDPEITRDFWALKNQLNDNPDCHLELKFDEQLAHLIYAGADMMVVPSLYEPCGLTQIMSMRYGTVPVVRSVGGLRDTVFDKDFSDHLPEHRNGFVFNDADNAGLESALYRAIRLWYDYPEDYRKLMEIGMGYDYSWNHPGQHYLNIYDHIRHK